MGIGASARLALALAIAGVVAGCGSGGSGSVVLGRGSAATFVINGRRIGVRESGTVSVSSTGAPQLNHNGPVGCSGRYFTANLDPAVRIYFRYGSRDAYLLVGSELEYLGEGPTRTGGQLEWQTAINGQPVVVRVACPPLPPGPRLAVGTTPNACAVLTASIAAAGLRQPVGRAAFVFENPELTACTYRSRDQTFSGDRRLQVSVGSASVISSLSSWSQPRLAGIGDEAHGGDPSIGLDARQGKLAVEVVADLGPDATDAVNLAAEKRVARALLGRLR
jgi:hypothetical protein